MLSFSEMTSKLHEVAPLLESPTGVKHNVDITAHTSSIPIHNENLK